MDNYSQYDCVQYIEWIPKHHNTNGSYFLSGLNDNSLITESRTY